MNNFDWLKIMDNGEFCDTIIKAGFYEMTVNEFCRWLKEDLESEFYKKGKINGRLSRVNKIKM